MFNTFGTESRLLEQLGLLVQSLAVACFFNQHIHYLEKMTMLLMCHLSSLGYGLDHQSSRAPSLFRGLLKVSYNSSRIGGALLLLTVMMALAMGCGRTHLHTRGPPYRRVRAFIRRRWPVDRREKRRHCEENAYSG